jgi:hypothetical protein
MAEVCAKDAAGAPPPPRPVAAKRPNFSRRGLPEARRGRDNVIDLPSAQGRRKG